MTVAPMRVFLAWEDVPKVRAILSDERGLHEERGQNDGSCEKYQRAIGGEEAVQRKDSWCLYFVLWGFLELVAGEMRALRFLVPRVTGSCEEFRRAARANGQLMPVGTAPLPGDIGLVVHTGTDHAHHAFFVGTAEPENPGVGITTAEGNSNATGGSNGDGAYVRDKRWGPGDPCTHGGKNHYELVRLTDPSIPRPEWV